jgi:endoglucanase
MKQAVRVMRRAGYRGPIAIPCIANANDCSDGSGSWSQYLPNDPANQLIAEAHVYGNNQCDTVGCFSLTILPILQEGHPVIWGEIGEDFGVCPSTDHIRTFLAWAEQNGVGTEAWTWDAWGPCRSGSLIRNYSGTPEDAYGSYVRSNYRTAFPPNG